MTTNLDAIRIVLCRPSHPGNIGAAARAMKNMGLRQLALVSPSKFPHPDAVALAADAQDVVEGIRVYDTLPAAIADCHLVVGTSARNRRIGWPSFEPKECAQRLVADTAQGTVALVFGHERTGLTNDELDCCQYVVSVPTSPVYPSLNLAAAVQILAYEIFQASGRAVDAEEKAPEQPLATAAELEGLYAHLETVLVETGFLDPTNPRLLMRRLTRLFGRAQLDRNEMNILRGILTSVQQFRARRGG